MALESMAFMMCDDGIERDAVTYSASISACVRGANCQKALCLFAGMVCAALEPDAVCCNVAINACEQRAEWQRSLALMLKFCFARNIFCKGQQEENGFLAAVMVSLDR